MANKRIRAEDVDILARTLYGEAESGNVEDAVAIACVVMNRVSFPIWPSTPQAVCLQPWQFSCWNANDPNRQRILDASGHWFDKCKAIATSAVKGELEDITHRSTHYYQTSTVKKPKWAKGKTPVKRVLHSTVGGAHDFFNNIDTPPPTTARESLEQQRPISSSGTVTAARAGIITATTIGAVGEAVSQASPAFPLVESLAKYSPWLIVVILLAVIGYMVWRRYDDRKQGLR